LLITIIIVVVIITYITLASVSMNYMVAACRSHHYIWQEDW